MLCLWKWKSNVGAIGVKSRWPAKEEAVMLKVGYWLMVTAGALLAGYVAYFLIRLLVTAPGIGVFFKVVILVGAAGLILTIAGLIWERRKEAKDAPGND